MNLHPTPSPLSLPPDLASEQHGASTARQAWLEHIKSYRGCRQCLSTLIGFSGYPKCEQGQKLYDELKRAEDEHDAGL